MNEKRSNVFEPRETKWTEGRDKAQVEYVGLIQE